MQFDSKDVTAAKTEIDRLMDDHFKANDSISKAEIKSIAVKAVIELSKKNQAALASDDNSSINSGGELITQLYGLDK